jgi:hypothetical protein
MDIFQYINILVCFEIMSHDSTYIGSCFVYVLFQLAVILNNWYLSKVSKI